MNELTTGEQARPTHAGDGVGVEDASAEAAAEREAFDLSESNILIVDDNEQNVELLQAYLEVLPCQIHTARDGIEAIKFVEDPQTPTPDLILLDVMMPPMSGFEACRTPMEYTATRGILIMLV